MTREELLKSKEYWMLEIQMQLHQEINKFMQNNNLNRKQLAEKLGVSKGYVSQILNGDFNHSMEKLVKLCLSIGIVPIVKFEKVIDIIVNDLYNVNEIKLKNLDFDYYIANLDKLVNIYKNKYIVIKDQAVVGAYDTQLDAYFDATKNFEPRTYIIMYCIPGESSYSQTFNSPAIF
jgi:transcriptional regulator with XRE-family HTH domain